MRYQDRVLYGTDMGIMPGQEPEAVVKRLEGEYARDWAYFATDGPIDVDGRQVEGLALPDPCCGSSSARTHCAGCRRPDAGCCGRA